MNDAQSPVFFITATDAEVELTTELSVHGLHVTSTAIEDGVTLGSVAYGPLAPLTTEEATTLLMELFGNPAHEFQEREAFEFVSEEGVLIILVKLDDEFHRGVEV